MHADLGKIVMTLVVGTAVAAPAALPSPAPAPVMTRVSPIAGPLIVAGTTGRHFCSGVVVHSTTGDLVMTAAHCLRGNPAGIRFAPGFRAGVAPKGYWRVTAAYVPPAWQTTADPDADVALLRVVPEAAGQRPIEAAVGGALVGVDPTPGTRVSVVGYVDGTNRAPISCTAATRTTPLGPAIDCKGFSGGTSGSGWITQTSQGLAVTGIIGGAHRGGCTADISYSPRLSRYTAPLLRRAQAKTAPDRVNAPRTGDGC